MKASLSMAPNSIVSIAHPTCRHYPNIRGHQDQAEAQHIYVQPNPWLTDNFMARLAAYHNNGILRTRTYAYHVDKQRMRVMDVKPKSQSHISKDDPPPPYTPQQCSANSTPNGDHHCVQVEYRRPRDLINDHGGKIIRAPKSPITFPFKIPLCQTTTYSSLIQAVKFLALAKLPSCSERTVNQGTLTYHPRKPGSDKAKQIDESNWCCVRESVRWERGDLVFEIVDLHRRWVEEVKSLKRTRMDKGNGKQDKMCSCGKGEKRAESRSGGCVVM